MSAAPLPDETAVLAHVRASAALLGLPMDEARAARVAAHLQRTAAMAALLEAFEMGPHDEIAAIYDPTSLQSTSVLNSSL